MRLFQKGLILGPARVLLVSKVVPLHALRVFVVEGVNEDVEAFLPNRSFDFSFFMILLLGVAVKVLLDRFVLLSQVSVQVEPFNRGGSLGAAVIKDLLCGLFGKHVLWVFA